MPTETPRWQQRLDYWQRSLLLLEESLALIQERELTLLEAQGVIQRFEVSFELAWKTLKDYLVNERVIESSAFPKSVLRVAGQYELIEDVSFWLNMLEDRNELAHCYDEAAFWAIYQSIQKQVGPALRDAEQRLLRHSQH